MKTPDRHRKDSAYISTIKFLERLRNIMMNMPIEERLDLILKVDLLIEDYANETFI